jgi:hypothetical protein
LACQVGNKKIARLGVTLVCEEWHFFMEDHPGIKYRSHPEHKLYDLHVNVVESIDTPAVRDCPVQSCLVSRKWPTRVVSSSKVKLIVLYLIACRR